MLGDGADAPRAAASDDEAPEAAATAPDAGAPPDADALGADDASSELRVTLEEPRGMGDTLDAAAFAVKGGELVLATVDAFRAFCDDPWLVGRVAAVNAVSDVLAKGGDWSLDTIVGREEVESWGGRVVRLREVPGVRTTAIVERARQAKRKRPGARRT